MDLIMISGGNSNTYALTQAGQDCCFLAFCIFQSSLLISCPQISVQKEKKTKTKSFIGSQYQFSSTKMCLHNNSQGKAIGFTGISSAFQANKHTKIHGKKGPCKALSMSHKFHVIK